MSESSNTNFEVQAFLMITTQYKYSIVLLDQLPGYSLDPFSFRHAKIVWERGVNFLISAC